LHILTLLENLKEQQTQLSFAFHNLAARLGTETPVAEMPHGINLPLATLPEVEQLEEWLKDAKKTYGLNKTWCVYFYYLKCHNLVFNLVSINCIWVLSACL